MSGALVVRVVPDVPAVHRQFDYEVPAHLAGEIRVGSRVRITFHGRRVAAWVVACGVTPPDGVVLQPIVSSSGLGPPEPVVELAAWAAWRWAGPPSNFFGTASPPRVVRSLPPPAIPPPVPVGDAPGGSATSEVRDLVDRALVAGRSVVRLAPALDAALVVTEVVRRCGPAGVLVLAPSHVGADRLAVRLRQAGVPVARMPDGWAAAAAGGVTTVGTRAAAFAPVPKLSAVVVLDSHDEAYQAEGSPTWEAWVLAAERAEREGVPCVLVSPCPPVTQLDWGTLVTTTRDAERRGWPPLVVVDRRGDDPRTGLFSHAMVSLARGVLDRPGGRLVCVLNRTGRVRLLACAACAALVRCTACGGSMAQDTETPPDGARGLHCARCHEPRPAVCAECGSMRLKNLRVGVTRAREELAALLGVEVEEMAGAKGAGPGDGAGVISAPVIVGTEAALHRVDRADAVVFLDFDQHLLAPRAAAAEESLALLARAARLVGGRRGVGHGDGRLLVQTRLPDHEVLLAAVRADPGPLAESERQVRCSLGLPPFRAQALLSGAGADDYAGRLAEPSIVGVRVAALGAGEWLVSAPDHGVLCDLLAATARPPERLRVAVDPREV